MTKEELVRLCKENIDRDEGFSDWENRPYAELLATLREHNRIKANVEEARRSMCMGSGKALWRMNSVK